MRDTGKSPQHGRGKGSKAKGVSESPVYEIPYSYGRDNLLSRIERMVLCQYTCGSSTKEIATLLQIKVDTVRSHKRTIKHKLNIRNFKKYCWKYRDDIHEDLQRLWQ